MKKLYIIRHAKSDWTNSEFLHDIDRPLNVRGVNAAYMMSARLNAKKVLPDLMLSSNGIRAMHTATIIAKEIGFEAKGITIVEDLFHSSEFEILKQINLHKNNVETMFLFAHNPGISNFANAINLAFEKIPTCSVLEIDIKKQIGELEFKDLNIVDFDYPKRYTK